MICIVTVVRERKISQSPGQNNPLHSKPRSTATAALTDSASWRQASRSPSAVQNAYQMQKVHAALLRVISFRSAPGGHNQVRKYATVPTVHSLQNLFTNRYVVDSNSSQST